MYGICRTLEITVILIKKSQTQLCLFRVHGIFMIKYICVNFIRLFTSTRGYSPLQGGYQVVK